MLFGSSRWRASTPSSQLIIASNREVRNKYNAILEDQLGWKVIFTTIKRGLYAQIGRTARSNPLTFFKTNCQIVQTTYLDSSQSSIITKKQVFEEFSSSSSSHVRTIERVVNQPTFDASLSQKDQKVSTTSINCKDKIRKFTTLAEISKQQSAQIQLLAKS